MIPFLRSQVSAPEIQFADRDKTPAHCFRSARPAPRSLLSLVPVNNPGTRYSRAAGGGRLRITACKLFPANALVIESSTSLSKAVISFSSSLRSLGVLIFLPELNGK